MLGTNENNLITHLVEAYNDEHGHEKPPNFWETKIRGQRGEGGGGGAGDFC
jgi:hypothetical protein